MTLAAVRCTDEQTKAGKQWWEKVSQLVEVVGAQKSSHSGHLCGVLRTVTVMQPNASCRPLGSFADHVFMCSNFLMVGGEGVNLPGGAGRRSGGSWFGL